jgi:ABC-type lipoprotein release transport system permease subunit
VVAGRAPRRADELLLGTRTLRAAGAHIGSTVVVGLGERTARMRVVGRGVLTEFAGTARLGEGAALTFAGMRRLAPDSIHNVVLVRMRDRARTDAIARALGRKTTSNVYKPVKPNDLADLQRVGGIPFVVASLLALLAAATLAHTLVTSVRRRRRDLSILKALGFVRTQLSRAVAWQASALAVVAVLVGLPLGIAAGRWVWAVFAGRLGVPPRPVTPVLAVTLLVPTTIVLANLVAAVPARLAARTQPAPALRTE